MAEEAAGEEEVRRRRKEEGAEVGQELRHGPVEGEAGGSLDWAGEVEERTCRDGTGAGEEVRRWGLLRVAVVGRCGRGREEEEVGRSCDGGVEEEVHLWMEVAEEEQDLETKNYG